MSETALLHDLAVRLRLARPDRLHALAGFDGFVDEIIHIVDKRYDADNYERCRYMTEFARRIDHASGLSANFEFVPMQQKPGGNGPNFALSLLECGCNVGYVGALGYPDTHPVFNRLVVRSSRVCSISEPGRTEALEFFDGKLICSRLEPLKAVSWEALTACISAEALARWIDECDILGFENWTLVAHMTSLWKHFLSDVLPLTKGDRSKLLFIDLCDPEKRSREDIREAVDCLTAFNAFFSVTLGLNLKECCELCRLYGREADEKAADDVGALCRFLMEKVGVDTVVVHPTRCACSAGAEGQAFAPGPYTARPKLTVGAGDNFNAGYVLGRALGFSERECLLLGTANSGFYVRFARSASQEELAAFIESWADGELEAEDEQ